MTFRLFKTLSAAAFAAAALGLAGAASAATIYKNSGATTPKLSDFSTAAANHPRKSGYASSSTDQMFLETFNLACGPGQRITGVKLEAQLTKLTQGPSRADNDSLSLWDNQVGAFGTYLWKATDAPNTTKQINLNLASLPTDPATGVTGSPAGGNGLSLATDGDLSVAIQDDTRVDWMRVTYECGGRVAVDVNAAVTLPTGLPRDTLIDTAPVVVGHTISHTVTHGTPTAAVCCPGFTKAYPAGFVKNMFTEGVHTSGTGLTQNFSGTAANSMALANHLKNWANWLAVDGCSGVAGFRITYSLYNTNGTVKPTSATLPVGSTLLAGSPKMVTYMNGVVSPAAFTWNVPASPNWWFIRVSVVTVNAQGMPTKCDKAMPCMNNLYSGFIDDATGMRLAPGAARPTRWAD